MSGHRADEQAIREMENEAREAAAAKDLERYASFYAEDAVLFWPGVPMVTGKAAIRAFMERFLAAAGFSLQFHTARVEVSSDATLAYSYGTNTFSFPGPGGVPVSATNSSPSTSITSTGMPAISPAVRQFEACATPH